MIKKSIFSIIFLIFILLVVSFFDIYIIKSNLFFGEIFSKIVPFPAVYVDGSFISYKNYQKFLNDYKIYFLFNENLEINSFRDSAIKQIIGISFIDKMQRKLDVKCENNQEYETFKKDFYIQNNINENIILKLKDSLNFNEEKFEDYVVFPTFCREKISQKLLTISDNTDQRKKIDQIYSDVVKNPDKFIEYSEQYYDKKISPIKKFSFLSKSDLPQNLSDIIDNMKIGDMSPVIQSISGYHIYRVESIVINKEQNQNFYEINQIFVPTKSLGDYINDYLANGKFKVLIP